MADSLSKEESLLFNCDIIFCLITISSSLQIFSESNFSPVSGW